jgi:hypothetical protein
MFYADRVGLPKEIESLGRFHGPDFQAAPLLVRLAAENKTFNEYDAGTAQPSTRDSCAAPRGLNATTRRRPSW